VSNKENKKRRRLERHIRNKNKEKAYKEEAWENGKLIEENHNNGPYSPGYTLELGQRLFQIMKDVKERWLSRRTKRLMLFSGLGVIGRRYRIIFYIIVRKLRKQKLMNL
jgi:hypothetical protein